jgi:hypothetical protein
MTKWQHFAPKEKGMAIFSTFKVLTLYFYSKIVIEGCVLSSSLLRFSSHQLKIGLSLSSFLLEKGNVLKALFPRV